MKKYISILLCAAVLTTTLAGCTSNEVQSGGNAPAAGGEVVSDGAETLPVQSSEASAVTSQTNDVSEETTVPEESGEVVGESDTSMPPAEVVVSEPYIPDTQPDIPAEQTAEPEDIPLTAEDILMELKIDGDLTTEDEYFKVEFTYIGEADCWYGFGCDYSLKKWDNDKGDWTDVQFSESAAWNALGYLISKESPHNSIGVSLRDDFYAEPLTAGTYMLIKPMCDGVVLEQTFEIK